jgi:hypothetical protein
LFELDLVLAEQLVLLRLLLAVELYYLKQEKLVLD